ncbi:uroporphyrinogen-III synthase [Halorussus gelatinilyticus]|uniref:Uroporphyrinogen-III synthase n=1 Tax=Halorussus gelatinilyticus TaxID=2937524 RepID=A0A8U0ILY0_9EURY|nr:uroporphyrinogen-III synthase [Halorussus gelatinilyticus]UPW01758.1 uroporphyrinogen-III synthase [Halorussus gelatinilyticus]
MTTHANRDVRAAVFRPDDERLAEAVELLDSLGADPVADPMLEVRPTGDAPADGEYVILTSKTGVELAADAGWEPGDATVCAIGESTADALRDAGYRVDLVPEEYSSSGLVEALDGEVEGVRVEVARSDHGSEVLTDGLRDAGAVVNETTLYELVRPATSGESAALAAEGGLDAALFTSSLTVAHFLDAAEERGVREEAIARLNDAVVGAIGEPTRETAEAEGIAVDVVPERADFEELACEAVEAAAPTYHE